MQCGCQSSQVSEGTDMRILGFYLNLIFIRFVTVVIGDMLVGEQFVRWLDPLIMFGVAIDCIYWSKDSEYHSRTIQVNLKDPSITVISASWLGFVVYRLV